MADGRRTAVWESDQPMRFFNVIAGRWARKQGKDTAVYYHAGHPYNIDEISEALDAARHYYSEWFYPYPWRELKLSEFSNQATYAQGFATNITFSRGDRLSDQERPESNMAFIVTAHEAAHQWWGNLVVPGKGPGGNVLSEGMAHFSTILLCEQVKGLRQRIEFCKRIEESYGEARRKDSEKPLVKTDGSRPGTPRSRTTRAAGSSGCCCGTWAGSRALQGHARVHREVPPEPGPPGAPGLRGHDAAHSHPTRRPTTPS